MNMHRAHRRWALALVGGVLVVLTMGTSAQARPDDGNLREAPISANGCPLERIGHQFVRCDDLTGAGQPAPSYVPEQ